MNGLCYALGSRGKFGFIDTLGNWRIKPRFSTARDFSESDNMALVTSWAEAIEGYAMPNGNCLYPSQIVGLDHFQEGVAKARPFDRLKYGFIDVYGEQFIPADFKYARGFKNGYAIAATDRLLGVIDKTGLWVIYPKFVYIGDFTLIN